MDLKEFNGILTLDVGGTFTRLSSIHGIDGSWSRPVPCFSFSPQGWDDLEEQVSKVVLEKFGEKGKRILAVSFAGRCLKDGEIVSVTKWGGPRERKTLFNSLKIKHKLFLNDTEAALIALLAEPLGEQMKTISKGAGSEETNVSLIYLGTGMGVGIAVEDSCFSSEFGGTILPLNMKDPLESKLSKGAFLSVETALSGPGLSFIAEKLGSPKMAPEKISQKINKGELQDPALLFAKLLGRASRMLVLTSLADKLVLGGRPLSALTKTNYPVFLEEFLNDKDHRWWLSKVNIEVCGCEELPSLGLYVVGTQMWEEKFG
jgi:glucokinase